MARKPNKQQVAADLAQLLNGQLAIGKAFSGTLQVDGLDIEIAVRVKRSIAPEQRRDYLAELLEGVEMGIIDRFGRCAVYVKSREGWVSRGTRECRSPVTHAVVTSSKEPSWRFHFLCRHHAKAEQHGPVFEVPKARLAEAITKMHARNWERERLSKMTPEERIAEDARMIGRRADADLIVKGAA